MADQEQLYALTAQISNLSGKFEAMTEQLEKTNDGVAKLLEKHDDRITDLEGSRNKAVGFLAAASVLSGVIGSWITKMIGP